MKTKVLLFVLICLVAVSSGQDSLAVDFAHEVVPILKKHCVQCHGGKNANGGFSLNTRSLFLENDAASPGSASDSHFLELIQESDVELQMPPKDKPRVPAQEVAILTRWIDTGMQWEPGFTFGEKTWQPPLKPRTIRLPPASNGRNHPIDRLLAVDMKANGVSAPEGISDAQFLRRATLDVVGLLPEPDVLASFLADGSGDKRETKIDQLLADDIAYADHWLTFWNDLLRNDYTGTGFITKGRTQITTWLYAALRSNKPYDMMVRELISPTEASAGFINGIKWRGNVNASQTRDIQFSQNISQVFLGINMKCASCHDSFVDDWKLSEAYNLAAIFSEKPLELNRCDKPTGVMAEPKWIFPQLGDVDPKASKDERLKQLAELMTHPENGRFTRTLVNRVWHRLMGHGIVHPVDAMDTQPWNEELLDYLAVRFAKDGYDLRKLVRFIMTSRAYQSECVVLDNEPGEDYVYTGPIAKRMTAEQLLDSIWQITGTNPAAMEANADRYLPREEGDEVIEPPTVIAKWIWHQGKVGKKSQLHKAFELKDVPTSMSMLATCDNAFVMKMNGKQVAKSREWTKPVYLDVAKFLVQGKNQIQVDAEMFGGAAGFIAQFNWQVDGKTNTLATDKTWKAKPPKGKLANAHEIEDYGSKPWGDVFDPAAFPRLGPMPPVRAALVKNDFLMRSLGRPHRDQVVTTRPAELTTLQAIDLANGDTLAGYLKKGAEQLVQASESHRDLGRWLYRFAYSRDPNSDELDVLNQVASDVSDPLAVEDLLWLVFMQPEFQIVR